MFNKIKNYFKKIFRRDTKRYLSYNEATRWAEHYNKISKNQITRFRFVAGKKYHMIYFKYQEIYYKFNLKDFKKWIKKETWDIIEYGNTFNE